MRFVLFGCIWEFCLRYEPWCKMARTCAKVRATKSRRNFLLRMQPIHLIVKLTFWCVSYYLGAFGNVCCVTTLSSKQARLGQKFMSRSRIGIFRNERTRSTPLDSKLMFWCVLYYLGAFGTVWLPYKIPCKTGQSGAKVRAMKSFRNFSKRTHPIHPTGP